MKNLYQLSGRFVLVVVIIFATLFNAKSQQNSSFDKQYFISYPKETVIRLFFSQKFAPFTISSDNTQDLNYKTNSKLNFGAGITYNNITANLSYGFKFLNKDKGQGTTKGLDLQIHLFPKMWSVDLIGSFLRGYYLDPGDDNGLHLTNFYLRPDVKRNILGFSAFRVPNADKFSYKAAITQSEWQTKSAGSLLYGGEVYYGSMKGDSALVPSNAASLYPQAGIPYSHFISVGIGGGYAYTLVIHKNYFISASAIATADVNFSREEKNNAQYTKTSLLPGGELKAALGYNSERWSISASILGNALYSGSSFTSKKYFLPTGNTRLTLAKKIGR